MAGALIALLAANIYLYVQIDHVRADLAKTQDKISTDIANIRDSSSVSVAAEQRHLEALKEELAAAREQARTMSSQAKVEAQAHADAVAKQIQAEEAQMNRKVAGQISDVQQQATRRQCQDRRCFHRRRHRQDARSRKPSRNSTRPSPI